jgi:hypothetical protein
LPFFSLRPYKKKKLQSVEEKKEALPMFSIGKEINSDSIMSDLYSVINRVETNDNIVDEE